MKIVLFIILFTIFTSMNSEVIWESDFGYFGADNAIGKVIRINNQVNCVVSNVIPAPPSRGFPR